MTKLILALQGDSAARAKSMFKQTEGWIDVYKIGIDLFTHTGNRLVKYFINHEAKVFLDLKFCDIPSVVAKASEICARLRVSMFTIHTMGGFEMMKMCADSLKEFCYKKRIKSRPLILGVTILTSISNKAFNQLWGTKKTDIKVHVARLAQLAKSAGLDGVICAGHEITAIKKKCGKDFLTVVPGIRIPTSTEETQEGTKVVNDDQSRAFTPAEASRAGADYIVVGRPIIRAPDPIAVIEKIREDIEKGYQGVKNVSRH